MTEDLYYINLATGEVTLTTYDYGDYGNILKYTINSADNDIAVDEEIHMNETEICGEIDQYQYPIIINTSYIILGYLMVLINKYPGIFASMTELPTFLIDVLQKRMFVFGKMSSAVYAFFVVENIMMTRYYFLANIMPYVISNPSSVIETLSETITIRNLSSYINAKIANVGNIKTVHFMGAMI